MERVAAPGMIALGVTMTLAAIDLLMSLTPHWYSTIFGVYFFADSVLGGLVDAGPAGPLAAGHRPAGGT